MSNDWFYQLMGVEQGPVSGGQLKQLADVGKIATDSMVKRGEQGSWVTADRIQGLFNQTGVPQKQVPAAPPPIQPPAPPPQNGQAAPTIARVSSVAFPLPGSRQKTRGLWGSIVFLIDPMFERYLTPWIIRRTWVLAIFAAIAAICLFGYLHFDAVTTPIPNLGVAFAERHLADAKTALQTIEEIKNSANWRTNPRSRPTDHPYQQPDQKEPSELQHKPTDPLKLAQQVVTEAEKTLESAKANAPSRWSQVMTRMPAQALLYMIELIGCVMAVLWIRVILEAGIVLFNIVTKLGSIDSHLAQMKTAQPHNTP